jgi:hypothetical protein
MAASAAIAGRRDVHALLGRGGQQGADRRRRDGQHVDGRDDHHVLFLERQRRKARRQRRRRRDRVGRHEASFGAIAERRAGSVGDRRAKDDDVGSQPISRSRSTWRPITGWPPMTSKALGSPIRRPSPAASTIAAAIRPPPM